MTLQTPGYLEIDLVSHAGASALPPASSCTGWMRDIHTAWVERQAVMGKGCQGVVQAMTTIEQQLPEDVVHEALPAGHS